MLPTMDRERTMMPRTTQNDLVMRYPGKSKAVVVKEWVWLISCERIEHETSVEKKFYFVSKYNFLFGRRTISRHDDRIQLFSRFKLPKEDLQKENRPPLPTIFQVHISQRDALRPGISLFAKTVGPRHTVHRCFAPSESDTQPEAKCSDTIAPAPESPKSY